MKPITLLCGTLLALMLAAPASAAEVAATVTMLTGRGTVLAPDGEIRALEKDAAVHAGELVSTGVNSFANLKFSDGGLVTLRPNSRFEIREYRYTAAVPDLPPETPDSAARPAGRAFFRLLKGGLRTITGLIGKSNPADYEASTPVATIGIRGTDYLAVMCELACQTDPIVRADLPEGASAAGASVIGVIEGRISVTTPNGETIEIGADEYILVLADGRIVVLSQQPRFLLVDPIPNPESCAA